MARLYCQKHGRMHEAATVEEQAAIQQDGESVLIVKGKLTSGPWLCDSCNAVLKKGKTAYLWQAFPARITERMDAYDFEMERQYFALHGDDRLRLYGTPWPGGTIPEMLRQAQWHSFRPKPRRALSATELFMPKPSPPGLDPQADDVLNPHYGPPMSRYEFVPDGWSAPYSLALSWDKPWRAYVALVSDKSVPAGQDWVILRIGCKPPHDRYPDLDDMLRALNQALEGKLPPVTLSDQMRHGLAAAKQDHFKRLRQEGIDPMQPMDFSHDDDEPEDYPTLAFPPLYVLRTAASCPECAEAMHVYTLGCDAYRDYDNRDPIEVFHFLRQIERVPEEVTSLLAARCPGYFPDRENESDKPYLMNHCRCGAKLDDDYLHGDVGAAFFPDVPKGYANMKLFLLPIDEPIAITSSWTIGGDDYLDFDQVEEWQALDA